MAQESADASPGLPFIVLGAARLPRSIAGEHSSVLMVEFVLDARDGRIVDVATTMALSGHAALLRRLLIGRSLDDVEEIARSLCTRLRGPLLRPTVAALVNAVANGKNRSENVALAVKGLQR